MRHIPKIIILFSLLVLTSCMNYIPVDLLGLDSNNVKRIDMETEVCKIVPAGEFREMVGDIPTIYTLGTYLIVLYKDVKEDQRINCYKEVKIRKEAEIAAQEKAEKMKKLEEENILKAEQEALEEQIKLDEQQLQKEKEATKTTPVQKVPVKKVIVPVIKKEKTPEITTPVIEEKAKAIPTKELEKEPVISDEAK